MPFTLTIKELLDMKGSFDKLTQMDTLPQAVKTRLAPIARSIKEHISDANEARTALFKQYGSPSETDDEDYDLRKSTPEQIRAVNAEWREVLKGEVEIPGKMLTWETVANATYIVMGERGAFRASLVTDDLLALDWLIKLPAQSEEVEEELPQAAQAATA